MAPEAIVLVVNAAFLAFAYGWAYPALPEKTWGALIKRDVAVNGAAVLVAGGLFWGTATRFSLVFFNTNWFIFSLVTFALMEMPLLLRFARKHNLHFDDL